MAQLHHPMKSDRDSPRSSDGSMNPASGLSESEKQTLNNTIAALRQQLATTEKQARDAFALLNSSRLQLDAQQGIHATKARGLEQRILQLTETEVSLKATYTQFRNERDAAVRREQEAMAAKDELQAQNILLSSQLSEMHDQFALKAAQLNDTAYVRDQFEGRVTQLNREIEHWRQCYVALASVKDLNQHGSPTSGPPPTVYFSVPQIASNRRNTAPNILQTSPNGVQYPGLNGSEHRPAKRPRVDSAGSTCTMGAHSRVSSSGSETFALRPVQPSHMVANQQLPSPTKSTHATSPTAFTYSTSPTTSVHPITPTTSIHITPTQAANSSSLSGPANTGGFSCFVPPRNPLPAVSIGPVPHRSRVPSPPTAPRSTAQPSLSDRVPLKQPIAAYVQEFLLKLFPPTAAGHPECKLCK